MPHRQPQRRALAERGDLIVELDPRRPSGRLLRQAGMEASYIDLADETHLEFEYMRWLRIVLRVARARRVLHIGGGACALARALAAEDPGARQEVCEQNATVLDMAREHLALSRAPGLRIRHAEGRRHLAAQADDSWDAIVIDAFVGARIPPRLITVEAFREAARVAPLTLVNVVDNRAAHEVKAVVASMAMAYPVLWTLGQPTGNTIVAGGTTAAQPDLARVRAAAAADPAPARLSPPDSMTAIVAATPARWDTDAS